MVSGLEEKEPYEVKISRVRRLVEPERGSLEFADTYFLAKLIMWGNENEKIVSSEEWKKRTGKPFPYHPSFRGGKYPVENLKSPKH